MDMTPENIDILLRKAQEVGDTDAINTLTQLRQSAAPHERSWKDVLLGRNLAPEDQAGFEQWHEQIKNPEQSSAENPSGAENVIQGATFNMGDNIARGLGFDEFGDRLEQRQNTFREQHPVGAMAYEALPQALMMSGAAQVPKIGALLNPTGLPAKMASGGLVSGGVTALNSTGDDSKSWGDVAKDTAVSTAIGGAMPLVTHMASKGLTKVAQNLKDNKGQQIVDAHNKAIPSEVADDVLDRARLGYEQLKDPSIQIKPRAMRDIINTVKMEAADYVDNPKAVESLSPKALNILRRIEVLGRDGRGRPVNEQFKELMSLKETLNDLLGSNLDKKELTALRAVKDGLFKGMDNLRPRDVIGGPANVGQILKAADKDWAKGRKLQMLERVVKAAEERSGQFSQSGMKNAIRTEAKQLLNQVKPSKYTGKIKIRGFDADEIAMLEKMADGSDINTFINWASKMSPRGGLSGLLQLMGIGGATAVGGPLLGGVAVAGSGLGYLAGVKGDQMKIKSLEALIKHASKAAPYKTFTSTPIPPINLPSGPAISAGIGAAASGMDAGEMAFGGPEQPPAPPPSVGGTPAGQELLRELMRRNN